MLNNINNNMATECLVTFKVSVKTELSQVVGIVGNQPELGNWDESKAPIMKTDPSIFPMWQTETPLIFSRGINFHHLKIRYQARIQIFDQNCESTNLGAVALESEISCSLQLGCSDS